MVWNDLFNLHKLAEKLFVIDRQELMTSQVTQGTQLRVEQGQVG